MDKPIRGSSALLQCSQFLCLSVGEVCSAGGYTTSNLKSFLVEDSYVMSKGWRVTPMQSLAHEIPLAFLPLNKETSGIIIFVIIITSYFVGRRAHSCHGQCMSEVSLQELVLPFHHVDFMN